MQGLFDMDLSLAAKASPEHDHPLPYYRGKHHRACQGRHRELRFDDCDRTGT